VLAHGGTALCRKNHWFVLQERNDAALDQLQKNINQVHAQL
jgi:hypothetical protein